MKEKYRSTLKRKSKKFEVPQEEKLLQRVRKPRKAAKNFRYFSKPRSFSKSEAIFYKWLWKNQKRFKHRLLPLPGGHDFSMENVAKELTLSLSFHMEPEANFVVQLFGDVFRKDGEVMDLLSIEYIGIEGYHPQKGFFDMDRIDGVFSYFPTREELYEKEVFEKIVEACNELITPQNSLYIVDGGGFSAAYIDKTDETRIKTKVVRKFLQRRVSENLSANEIEELYFAGKLLRVFKVELVSKEAPKVYYIAKGETAK